MSLHYNIHYNIQENDINEEANQNHKIVKLNVKNLNAEKKNRWLKDKIEALIQIYSNSLKLQYPQKKMLCYVWYDEMNMTLNISAVSTSYGVLPFACKINMVNDLNKILEEIQLINLKPIALEELINHQEEEWNNNENFILKVFKIQIPFEESVFREFPGEYLDTNIKEIVAKSMRRDQPARKAHKLLKDKRFSK